MLCEDDDDDDEVIDVNPGQEILHLASPAH